MDKKFNFEEADRTTIDTALHQLLKIEDKQARTKILDQIEETGTVRVFGYGSLINDPHAQTSTTFDAELAGYKAGFFCIDNFYRGTRTHPGLTLGLDKEEGALTPGVVLQKDIIGSADKAVSAAQVVEYIAAFARREIPPNMPIYKFELVEVTAKNGASVHALACVADHNATVPGTGEKLYIGDLLNTGQKAAIIATALGDIRHDPKTNAPVNAEAGRRTNYQYFLNFIDARLKRGFPIEPELRELAHAVNAHRKALSPEERQELEALENQAPIHPDSFVVSTEAPELSQGSRLLNARSAEAILNHEGFTPVR